jgi:hypothetical protein
MASLGHIRRDEPHPAILELEKKGRVAAQTVKSGDYECGSSDLCMVQSSREIWPVIPAATLNFCIFAKQLACAAVAKAFHRAALGIQA